MTSKSAPPRSTRLAHRLRRGYRGQEPPPRDATAQARRGEFCGRNQCCSCSCARAEQSDGSWPREQDPACRSSLRPNAQSTNDACSTKGKPHKLKPDEQVSPVNQAAICLKLSDDGQLTYTSLITFCKCELISRATSSTTIWPIGCMEETGSIAETSTFPSSFCCTTTLQGKIVPTLSSAWSAR